MEIVGEIMATGDAPSQVHRVNTVAILTEQVRARNTDKAYGNRSGTANNARIETEYQVAPMVYYEHLPDGIERPMAVAAGPKRTGIDCRAG